MRALIAYFILFSVLSAVDRYEVLTILDDKVYFPKSNASYIEELLVDSGEESLLALSDFYCELGYKDASLKYLEAYKGKNRAKVAEIYDKLGEYNKELNILMEIKPQTKEEYKVLFDKLKEISEKSGIDFGYEYSSFEIFYLTSMLNNSGNFKSYYSMNSWTEEDKRYIENLLFDKEFNLDQNFFYVYNDVADSKRKLEKAYKEIKGYEDNEAYFSYFRMQDELGMDVTPESDFELLQKYKYKGETELQNQLYGKMLNKYLAEGKEDKLMTLYFIDENYKLAYNLALQNESLHFKFLEGLLKESSDEDMLIRAISDFEKKYPKNSYLKRLTEIKASLIKDAGKKLDVYAEFFKQDFDWMILLDYVALYEEIKEEQDTLKLLEYFIFDRGIEEGYLVEKYIAMSSVDENTVNKLMLLNDKKYYFEEAEKLGLVIPFFIDKEYKAYLNMNSDVSTTMVSNERKLLEEGSGFAYFYFQPDFVYSADKVELLELKGKLNSAEEYYLMKYYEQEEIKVEEAEKLSEKLNKYYLFN